MAISASINANDIPSANADMEALGHGPGNFSVALRENETQETATHGGLHLGGRDPGYLEDLQSLQATYPLLVIRHDSETVFNFSQHVSDRSLEWTDPTNWVENPIMEGDTRTHDGKDWVSLIDYNVWEPPIGWREVVADGVAAWVQPTGAHDAYSIGEEVTHDNPNDGGNIWVYRSNIDANTTEPGRDGTFDRWWEPVRLE